MGLRRVTWAAAFVVLAAIAPGVRPAANALAPAQSDLDVFMQQVVARRDDNWKKLQQYILDEHEAIELRGPSHTPLWGERRDYTWYVRDGFFVRSPVRFNGVTIGESERRKYEEDYLRRLQRREGRGRGDVQNAPAAGDADQAPGDIESLIRQTRQPEFVSSAYFLRFRFDEGHYALVGREALDGHDALRIEYYPTKLFAEPQGRGRGRGNDPGEDAQFRTLLNKSALVTLWVDQTSHQILKYTIENITPNFIPANWLGQVSGAHASMTMGQPFPDVWLPRGVDVGMTVTLAIGDFDLRYALDYSDYHQADVTSTLQIPDAR